MGQGQSDEVEPVIEYPSARRNSAGARLASLQDRDPLEKKLNRIVLQERDYGCDGLECDHSPIQGNKRRYVCVECSPLDNSFDLCESCCTAGHEHELIMFDPSHTEPIAKYKFLAESVANRMRCFGGHRMIGTLKMDPADFSPQTDHLRDAYSYVTYNQLYIASRSLATRALEAGQFVGLVGETSLCAADWITADLACLFSGAVSVPLHYTFTEEQMVAVFEETKVQTIFCSVTFQQKLLNVAAKMTDPPGVVVFGSEEWKLLAAPINEWKPIVCSNDPNDMRTLFYTSGSTGQPKGVMISDRMLNNSMTHLSHLGPQSIFAYEPLGYATQRLLVYQMISCGGRICVHSSNMDTLFEEIAVASPSSFSAPPRIWGLLYAKWKARVAQMAGKYPDTPLMHIEDVVRQEFKGSLGGCRNISTGGAITPKVVWDWMEATFGGMHVSEGYGCSECGSIASNGHRKFSVRVRVEAIPELGYTYEEGVGGKGLLWVHTGQQQTQGYFNNQEKNDENFKYFPDSKLLFYNTGDIVEYYPKTEHLRVIDRRKNLLRLSSAVFVAPEYLETIYTACTLIQTLFVYAESERDFVLAVVIPNKGCSGYSSDSILAQMRACGIEAGLQPYEIPHAIIVEEAGWTVENGMLTSSFKLKRLALTARYRAALHSLYEELDGVAEPLELSTGTTSAREEKHSLDFERIVCSVLRLQECPLLSCRLSELGVDSVAAVHFQTLLGGLGHKPTLQMILVSTLAQIKEFVLGDHLAKPERVDFAKETELPSDIPTPRRIDPEKDPRVTLLTGATGFLGVFILHRVLLEDPLVRVVCHIRGPSEAECLSRLRQQAERTALEPPLEWSRVSVVRGDLSEPLLGLQQQQFTRLSETLSLVIHCGARVNGLLGYAALRAVNVSSTLECLRLRCPLVFVSSLSSVVSGDPTSESASPAQLSLEPLPRMSGYGASKRVSEILLHKAAETLGCRVAVVRPGTIGGCAHSGAYNRADTLPRLIAGILQMHSAPDIDRVVSALDVRLVARIAARAERGTYHARGHNGVTVAGIGRALGVPLVPLLKWKKKLWLCSRDNPLYPLKEVYFAGQFPLGSSWTWADSRAMQLCQDSDVSADLTLDTVKKWAQWLSKPETE